MAKRGKKYTDAKSKQPSEVMSLVDGVKAVKKLSYSSFKGSIEMHVSLKLPKDKDPKSLKGAISLPHSTGDANVTIAVFTNRDNEAAAKEAGADIYEMEVLSKELKDGKVSFDVAIATPDVMGQIAAFGKVLGPKGLMPNPKTGTVTTDLKSAVSEYKKGKMNFRSDDTGAMHFKVGTTEQTAEQVIENINVCLEAAAEVVGKKIDQVVNRIHLAPTMGPSVEVELSTKEA